MSSPATTAGLAIPVRVHGVSKRFGAVQALREVSLDVPENSIFGVLGPNGAGKTTLFSVLTGFVLPDDGSVEVLSTTHLDSIRGRLSILPQDALFQSNIPIIDQLSFFLTLMGWSRASAEEEVLRVLKLVRLDDVIFRDAATLSHGMYKRLALAQAFLGRPEVIILDEPTAGLDAKSAEEVRQAIKRLQKDATVLVSSHDLEEMHALCDHVAILDRGELVAVGPVNVIAGGVHAVRVQFHRQPTDAEVSALAQLPGVAELVAHGEEFEILLDAPEEKGESSEADFDRTVAAVLSEAITRDLLPRKLVHENRLKRLYMKVTR
jgi:ABC-2 type transport system ATP-binding protein